MIQFPLQDGIFAIIEPGNIKRLKSDRPMKVGNAMIAYVPDAQYFMKLLGVSQQLPSRGERIECQVNITPEQIDAALKACKGRAEVDRQ